LWVIVLLVGLAGLAILILSVPLDLTFQLDTEERWKFRLRFTWLFGMVSKEAKKGKQKKPEEKPGKKSRFDSRTVLLILRTKGLLKQIKSLIKGILGQLKIRELIADLRVGLGDPADTGVLFAFIGPTTVFVNSLTTHRLRVQPAFGDEAVLDGYLSGHVRLWPIRLVTVFLKTAFSLATIRVIRTLVLSKWKRKK